MGTYGKRTENTCVAWETIENAKKTNVEWKPMEIQRKHNFRVGND